MPHGVSTAKGSTKKGAQKYQNTFAFKHNSKSRLTQKINGMPNDGVCIRCFEQIEWRKRYRKYKPLTTAKKCTDCQQKSITQAYHVICGPCAHKKEVCAKCLEKKDLVKSIKTETDRLVEENELRLQMMSMSERERRSYFRKLDRHEDTRLDNVGDADYVSSDEDDYNEEDGDDSEEDVDANATQENETNENDSEEVTSNEDEPVQ